MRVFNAGFGMLTSVVTKVIGVQVLRDVQTFVSALDTMFGGFRERAEDTYRLLQAPGTAFLVIATPEPDALREASYFVERLSADRMPLAGLVAQPGAPLAGAAALRRPQPGRGRGAADRVWRRQRRRGIRWPWPRCGCTRSGCSSADREHRLEEQLHRGPPGDPDGGSARAARGRP